MLNSLWQTVGFGGSNPQKKDVFDSEDSAEAENEDEIAARLLSQFPAYGTNIAHSGIAGFDDDDDDNENANNSNANNANNKNNQYDKSNKNNGKKEEDMEDAFEAVFGFRPSAFVKSNNNNSGNGSKESAQRNQDGNLASSSEITVELPWDDDEQNLWKTEASDESTSKRVTSMDWNNSIGDSSLPKASVDASSNAGGKNRMNDSSIAQSDSFYEWDDKQRKKWVDGSKNSTIKNGTSATSTKSSTLVNATSKYLLSPSAQFGVSTGGVNANSNIQTPSHQQSEALLSGSVMTSSFSFKSKTANKEHWMPDQLCKQCYNCDEKFTVFRRRHHCRLCGQVFCSNCSSYFVEVTEDVNSDSNNTSRLSNTITTMRVCKICFEGTSGGGIRASLIHQKNNPTGSSVTNSMDQNQHQMLPPSASSATPQQLTPLQQQKKRQISPPISPNESSRLGGSAIHRSTGVPSGGFVQQEQHATLTHQMDGGGVLSSLKQQRLIEAEKDVEQRRSPLDQLAQEHAKNNQSNRRLFSSPEPHVTNSNPRALLEEEVATLERLALDGPADPTIQSGSFRRKKAEETAVGNLRKANSSKSETNTSVDEANRYLGLTAASHLEMLCKELLNTEAPVLLNEIQHQQQLTNRWVNTLMTLATRTCATVEPNVKKGDLLDIRPYCKIKVIPGGCRKDSAYMSGVLFRKNVSHKRMAKEIDNPRIMLLSGSIDFTRTENRKIASLETIFEQEEKYMEILVGKILKLKPDILLVGRTVSRKAQELLLRAKVVLVQQVKSTLLSRISRQTGATVISSTDHVMNTFGEHVLGKCRRFRLVTFRDNELWFDKSQDLKKEEKLEDNPSIGSEIFQPRIIQNLLENPKLSNHERQAALAASLLGERVLDGEEAVKRGLAKRGVAQTYVMLEGCPKQLGCTVVLRGASRDALKQVKRIFRFLVNVAYNLRLETCYLKERSAKLPLSFKVQQQHLFSSSLCVDYGNPPGGRSKFRPWNGRNSEAQRTVSGKITAFDHQSILITSVWMTGKTQCCPAEVKGICYYSLQDVSLGQFLRDSCFNLSLKCQNSTCKKSVLDHSLSFIHNDGLINITVEHMDDPLPPSPLDIERGDLTEEDLDDSDAEHPIATWTYCVNCSKVVTPLVYISEDTWKYSFGKFLESFFYNRDAVMNSSEQGCSCQMQSAATLYFGCGRLAARFTYEKIRPFAVFVRRSLPMDDSFHRSEALRQLDVISLESKKLFLKFDTHLEKVSREARSLFGSAVNRPEHLQTVLSELSTIGSEVDHAAKTLQEKIISVSAKCEESMKLSRDGSGSVNEALFRFPWYSRRYLFMLTSAWNERLSAAGQALIAMKKLADGGLSGAPRSDLGMTDIVIGDDKTGDDLTDSMDRLRRLHDVYSQYNVTDITSVIPGGSIVGQEDNDDDEIDFDETDAVDFSDTVDADVIASRRRFYKSHQQTDGLPGQSENRYDSKGRPPRISDSGGHTSRAARDPTSVPNDLRSEPLSKNKSVTPGGAVKSALNRFFNRGARDDEYVVDLGIFKEGHPRLEIGVDGIIVPVIDDQPSTVIAYSLSSPEYKKQFQQFSKGDGPSHDEKTAQTNRSNEENTRLSDTLAASQRSRQQNKSGSSTPSAYDDKKEIERRMLVRNKSHIKHTFRDYDEKGQQTCKFVCTAYWATQFHAVRQAFLMSKDQGISKKASLQSQQSSVDVEKSYIQSLSSSLPWAASGGKSGASFARTRDERFVIKCISRTELQMFLDCAPAYFEYLSKAFFHGLPTVLCKIVGVYQIGSHDRITGKRTMEQVAIMQNIFFDRKITQIFDLKGSLRGRFAKDKAAAAEAAARVQALSEGSRAGSDSDLSSGLPNGEKEDGLESEDGDINDKARVGASAISSNSPYKQRPKRMNSNTSSVGSSGSKNISSLGATLLDGDFLEFTGGRPLPLTDRAKAVFHMSVLNDTLFLSIINVLDYSILVGIDEERMELVVGIIDFMRQYDILKQMERVGKSIPMVVGSEAPTIIQPPLYKARFTNAMERYFMTVPNKFTLV